MSSLRALTVARAKGFVRDRATLFWVLLFPLMFLVIFGALFSGDSASKSDVIQVGGVPLIDELPADARTQFDDLFELSHSENLDEALVEVRNGDADGAITMDGEQIALYYSPADPVVAARLQGTIQAFVQSANVAATGQPPTFTLDTRSVDDDSLEPIQYIAPGIIGWAVAMGAVFGAALTLVQWRVNKLLRRIRLSPSPTTALIGAQTLVTVVVAVVQLGVFLAVGKLLFGLQLTDWWLMSVPLVIAAALAFMGIGVLAGSVSSTVEGASGLANLIILPMAFLSGSFIPVDQGPDWLATVAKFLPLGYLNEGLLDVLVRGQGPSAIVGPVLVLLGFAVVAAAIGVRLFRWDP